MTKEPLSIYLVLMLLEGGKEEWGECGALPHPNYPIINEGAPITPSPSLMYKWSWFIKEADEPHILRDHMHLMF